jgi:NADPH-dependent glutamate synthase beta subunit-like oxidoreductase/coenzyme F420-reducing hydrogenase delta subunit/Pyruvate/2-oxoacid:ferredoxin oxidoreductase delta subunit
MNEINSALVVGSGIDGIQASISLANSGIKVYLIEKGPLTGTNSNQEKILVNDCTTCLIPLKFAGLNRYNNIELIRNADIVSLEGEPGKFKATIYKKSISQSETMNGEDKDCMKQCPFIDILKNKDNTKELGDDNSQFSAIAPLKILIEKRRIPPCENACPAHVKSQDYVDLIIKGQYKESLNVIRERCPLPSVIGRVCPHPCETACNRGDIEEPVNICGLKRFVADHVRENSNEVIKYLENKKEKKVAVVGSGPAGLTVAYHMGRLGYPVTIFEKSPVAGGMLRLGIPDYRLPPEIIQADIDHIKKYGVEIKLNSPVGPPGNTIDDLLKDFDAVFLGVGLQLARELKIEGSNLENVLYGIDFLKKCGLGEQVTVGKNVLVIGGGDVAVDVARTALRKGAKEVHMVTLESEEILPAHPWEVTEAREEGIVFHTSLGPDKFVGENGKVIGLETIVCESVYDDQGRFNPVFGACSEDMLKCDMVFVTIGQAADLSFLDKDINVGRGIEIDQGNFQTSKTGVFAGGEVVTGPGSAINAIATGNKVAIVIDQFLKGEDISSVKTIPDYNEEDLVTFEELKRRERIEPEPRKNPKHIPPDERKTNFKEFALNWDENLAIAEANRCLSCGICCECTDNVKKCVANSIDARQSDETISIDIDNVFLTPGEWLSCFDLRKLTDYRWEIVNPIANVDTALCIGCNRCADVCNYNSVGVKYEDGFNISKVDPQLCKGCGDCVAECPGEAISMNRFGKDRIEQIINYTPLARKDELRPKILAFLCSWCSYSGADLASLHQYQGSLDVQIIRVMCSAAISKSFILQAFLNGADGVIIGGCHLGKCHHVEGNLDTQRRFGQITKGLGEIGINRERLNLEWFSPNEENAFSKIMNDFITKIKKLGSIETDTKSKNILPEGVSVKN